MKGLPGLKAYCQWRDGLSFIGVHPTQQRIKSQSNLSSEHTVHGSEEMTRILLRYTRLWLWNTIMNGWLGLSLVYSTMKHNSKLINHLPMYAKQVSPSTHLQTWALSLFGGESPDLEVNLPISPNLPLWEKVSLFAKGAGLGRWGDCKNVILAIFCYKFSYVAYKFCGTM